ncbi:MAG: hypothetical protein J0H18_09455 [Rhizobiales bacterium]|nr:hypothetical protein [Hyphomicrobiales bacterium]OJX99263.1 MAG: hypothetical protein BGP07_04275 [Rhizobiales bacterium 63-22]
MQTDHMKPLIMSAVLATLLGISAGMPQAHAEDAAQQPAAKEAAKPAGKKPAAGPVETTKPSEQTQTTAEGVNVPPYRDDRSTPQALVESYYNAINRKEYARAYDYYSADGREKDFKTFVKGYAKTKSVRVALRPNVQPDPGAGQIYWSQPLAIESESTDGKKEVFTGCYTIHLANPAIQEEPPFKPMEIMSGSLTKSPLPLEKSVPEGCEGP